METEEKIQSSSVSSEEPQRVDDSFLADQKMDEITRKLRQRGYKVTEEYDASGQLTKISGELSSKRTLWDILPLLIIAILLVGLTTWFNANQSQISKLASQQQHITAVQISQQQIKSDNDRAANQQREDILVNYEKDISDLLLTHSLSSFSTNSVQAKIVSARTILALNRLDPDRKGLLLQFISGAQLIKSPHPIISLLHADLTQINLVNADLSDADLSGADLSHSDLDLTNFSHADLHNAKFRNTSLWTANFSGANLSSADITGSILNSANLSGANLRNANLGNANLFEAQIDRADLSGADLQGAQVDDRQLKTTSSLKNVIMPNGAQHY